MTEGFTAALTFDDGVSPWTPGVLALLTAYSAKATFFVCGHTLAAGGDLLRRMVDQGCEVGNHTFNHRRLSELPPHAIHDELSATTEEIIRAIGQAPTLYRAPHFDDHGTEEIAARLGMRHVVCTIDPGDWATDDPTEIARRVLDRLEPGAIVDLHDGIPPGGGSGTASRAATVEATRIILELTPQVEWVTVSEL